MGVLSQNDGEICGRAAQVALCLASQRTAVACFVLRVIKHQCLFSTAMCLVEPLELQVGRSQVTHVHDARTVRHDGLLVAPGSVFKALVPEVLVSFVFELFGASLLPFEDGCPPRGFRDQSLPVRQHCRKTWEDNGLAVRRRTSRMYVVRQREAGESLEAPDETCPPRGAQRASSFQITASRPLCEASVLHEKHDHNGGEAGRRTHQSEFSEDSVYICRRPTTAFA